jgi:hypothetical protein
MRALTLALRTAAAKQQADSEARAKWCGRMVARNGSDEQGRVRHAWQNVDSVGLYVESTTPPYRCTVTDSEHWTIVREREGKWTCPTCLLDAGHEGECEQ